MLPYRLCLRSGDQPRPRQEGKRKLTESAREFPKASTWQSLDGLFQEVVTLGLLDIGELESTGSLAGCGKTIVHGGNSMARRSRATENSAQDAQKGQTSHPPNPGALRRALSQARPQLLADPRFTFHASRFTVPVREVRTPLADVFSILLGARACD